MFTSKQARGEHLVRIRTSFGAPQRDTLRIELAMCVAEKSKGVARIRIATIRATSAFAERTTTE